MRRARESIHYVVMLVGLTVSLEQFYVLHKASMIMVWVGLGQFATGVAIEGLRRRRDALVWAKVASSSANPTSVSTN